MVDLDDIFKQAMLLKKNKNNANNAINANNVRRCKVCGSYQLVETDDGDEMVCMACGALQGYQLMENAIEFNNNNVPVKAVKFKNKEEIDYVKQCVDVLHNLIFKTGGEAPVPWVEHTKKVYRDLLKARGKKLRGSSLAIVCGIIIECYLIKLKKPIIRPRMIEYAIHTARSMERSRDVDHKTYERYRSDDKTFKLRSVLGKEGCFDRKPSIYEYTIFAMNMGGFDDTRKQFVMNLSNAIALAMDMDEPMVDDVVLRKSNDQIAACLLYMASDKTYDLKNVKTVYGMNKGYLKPMYDALLRSENPRIKAILGEVNLNNKLVNEKKIKNYFTIDGKKCASQQKDVVRREAMKWAKSKTNDNDKAKKLITKPNGTFLSIAELCRLMSQN